MIVELVANALLVSILTILLGWTIVLSLAYIATKHAHERQLRWMNARLDAVTHRVSEQTEMSYDEWCERMDAVTAELQAIEEHREEMEAMHAEVIARTQRYRSN